MKKYIKVPYFSIEYFQEYFIIFLMALFGHRLHTHDYTPKNRAGPKRAKIGFYQKISSFSPKTMKLGHKKVHKSTLFFTKFGNDRRKIVDFLIKA